MFAGRVSKDEFAMLATVLPREGAKRIRHHFDGTSVEYNASKECAQRDFDMTLVPCPFEIPCIISTGVGSSSTAAVDRTRCSLVRGGGRYGRYAGGRFDGVGGPGVRGAESFRAGYGAFGLMVA